MNKQWTLMFCDDCERIFAVQEITDYLHCPSCGSDDVGDTGEYLSGTLYTEDGEEIQ